MARLTPHLLLAALAVLLAGCTNPTATIPTTDPTNHPIERETVSGTPGAVGGSVRNSAPTVTAFTQSATSGDNRGGFAVVFSGTVSDPNTEQQIKRLTIRSSGAANTTMTHDITNDEVRTEGEPAAFGPDGWRVWGGAKNDGVLHYAYRHEFVAFAPTGTYSFKLGVEDRTGEGAESATLDVTIAPFSDITISSTPVSATGQDLAGQNWGQWSAEAGARDVTSTNYLKLVNTGDAERGRIVIDFAPAFIGVEDANWTIPTANNLAFAWFEDKTPARTAPNEGEYTFLAPNADGTVTVDFTGKGNVIYVTYRVLQLPSPLPIQSYGITFTATEL